MKEVKLTHETVGNLTLALSHLVHGGIGTADALVLLGQDEPDPKVRAVLAQMAQAVDGGCSLAEAVRQSGIFPEYVCALLQAGQLVGKTEEALEALATHYSRRHRLEQQLKTALSYPAMLFGVLVAVVAVLLIWVLPVFDGVYARLGGQLTGAAGILLALGQLLKRWLPVWLGLILLAGGAAAIPPVRERIFGWLQRRWGHRGVMGQIHKARCLQVVTLGICSGMPPREAVELAAAMAQQPVWKQRCQQCLQEIDGGQSLSRALAQGQLLEAKHRRLLEAGERSGRSAQVLQTLSEQLLEESEEALQRQAAKIEPAMVTVACLLIGSVLLTVMLPLMHILSAIG